MVVRNNKEDFGPGLKQHDVHLLFRFNDNDDVVFIGVVITGLFGKRHRTT